MPEAMKPVFAYDLITKSGKSKVAIGVITSAEPLAFDSVIKWATEDGPVLYRVVAINFSEDANGVKRTATALEIVGKGAKIVAVDLVPAMSSTTEDAGDGDGDEADTDTVRVLPARAARVATA